MMRRALLLSVVLAGACDNDTRSPGDDVTDVPLCDPAACTTPPPASCDVDQITLLSSAAGTCGVDGCEYAPVAAACDTDRGYCRDGACVVDDDICDYAWGDRLSIIHVYALGGQSDERDPANGEPSDACCFDLDGKGGIDNGLGAAFKTLAPVLGDINEEFADQITRARLNLVLDFFAVDDLINDAHIEMAGYEAVHDEQPADNPAIASGFATFGLRARSFHLPAHLPRILASGAITQGHFVADRASYSFIFATAGDSVAAFPVRDMRFEGRRRARPERAWPGAEQRQDRRRHQALRLLRGPQRRGHRDLRVPALRRRHGRRRPDRRGRPRLPHAARPRLRRGRVRRSLLCAHVPGALHGLRRVLPA
jgi:hypothetical protein